jgi:hypothetical protein
MKEPAARATLRTLCARPFLPCVVLRLRERCMRAHPLRLAAALRARLAPPPSHARHAAPHARMASGASGAAAVAPASASATPPPHRGAFIVLEGADRAGKSTQCARLVASLRAAGVDAASWRFPDRASGCGQMIDAYLRSQSELDDAAVHLLFSANRWEKRCVRARAAVRA